MSSSVFANFKARFALGCDADTSAAVLGNAAASRINKRELFLQIRKEQKRNTISCLKFRIFQKTIFTSI